MKRVLTILLFSTLVFGQEGTVTNPGVELPDFVITGKDIMNLQQTKKPEAEMIPIISPEFLRPPINPEKPELQEISGPGTGSLKLRDTVLYNTGRIKTMLGMYTLPFVDAFVSSPFKSGLFKGYLTGKNIRPYEDNSERYSFNGGAGLTMYSDYNSSFMPGTEYNLSGDFLTRSYKLFAGNQPQLKRNLYRGNVSGSIKNIYFNRFNAGISADFRASGTGDEEYSENLFILNGFTKFSIGKIIGGVDARYVNERYHDSTTSGAMYNYFAVKPYAGFEFSRILKAAFGFSYSQLGDAGYFVPYASIGFRLSDNLSVFGEYTPQGEFVTSSQILELNMYADLQNNPNFFVKKRHDLKGMIKYEYSRYFEINGGVSIKSYKNLPFFTGMKPNGSFSLMTTEADHYGIFLNLIFNRGPFGYFYASAEAGGMENDQDKYVPYFPSFNSSLTYGYDFPMGLNLETSLIYRSGIYTDAANILELDPYINLELGLSYRILNNLKLLAALNNILDRKNYLWENYREIPMDFSAGVSYIW